MLPYQHLNYPHERDRRKKCDDAHLSLPFGVLFLATINVHLFPSSFGEQIRTGPNMFEHFSFRRVIAGINSANTRKASEGDEASKRGWAVLKSKGQVPSKTRT